MQTDPDILRLAHFDPEALQELALDPRAYDFNHPVNKRPNYHFGQWDPQHLDTKGRYRRFVVQQVTLDALMRRLIQAEDIPAEERLLEAAAVLAGTILMASGVCGWVSRQACTWRQASSSTQLPNFTMRPVSSASGMKCWGRR